MGDDKDDLFTLDSVGNDDEIAIFSVGLEDIGLDRDCLQWLAIELENASYFWYASDDFDLTRAIVTPV